MPPTKFRSWALSSILPDSDAEHSGYSSYCEPVCAAGLLMLRHHIGRPPLAEERGGDGAGLVDGEDDDRDSVVAREREGGGVHDLQFAGDGLVVGEAFVALGVGVLLRVRGVDAVD